MRVCLQTFRVRPEAGLRVRVCRLVYLVTAAEESIEFDDASTLTEVDIQPTDGGKGPKIIDAVLVRKETNVQAR